MILLGILAASGAGAAAGSYDLLATEILTDNTSTEVEFLSSGVWSDYEHLQIRMTPRIQWAGTATGGNVAVYLNDTTSTYYSHFLRGNGSAVSSGTESGPFFNRAPYNNGTTEFGAIVLDILDINSTNKNTTMRALGGSSLSYSNWINLQSAAWFTTSQVTSIQIQSREGTLGSGSRFSLYGLKAGA